MNKKILLKQLLFIPVFLITGFIAKSQLLTEGFEGAVFPPAGWLNETSAGGDDILWEAATTDAEGGDDINGVPFTVSSHTGTGMAVLKAYDFSEGNAATFTTSAVDLTTPGSKIVSFWMFRESGYDNHHDSVSVFINTTAGLTGATLLGIVHRFSGEQPIATGGNGWYKYTYSIPPGFNTASNYIILEGMSDFGNNMFIDDVTVEEFAACTGTPSAGTITGPASICPGSEFILENTGATDAAGMNYLWQSSANTTGPWTNIPGQTGLNNAAASQTNATYYRFLATCTNSGQYDSSNVIQVSNNPVNLCYCKPPDAELHSFADDNITNVTIQGSTLNSSNGTDAVTGYTQVPPTSVSNTGNLSRDVTYTIVATVQDDPAQVSCWIDFNNNGAFDPAEYTDLVISGTTATGTITVPADAVLTETGFRIRARFGNFTGEDACNVFGSGETEDYLINITANSVTNGALVGIIPASSCSSAGNVVVKLRNSGNQNIAAGAATVALYVTGANPQGPLTQANPSLLLPGDTATLTFAASFPVLGTNTDSAVIQSLAGDGIPGDNVIVTSHTTLPAAVTAPYAQDFEGAVQGWNISSLAGGEPDSLWVYTANVKYPDYTPPYTLAPKSGSSAAMFNGYTFVEGIASRLSTNCINIPANANNDCGYVAGFYFTQDAQYSHRPDSIVFSISTDGGNTYNRLGVVQRPDSSLATSIDVEANSIPKWKLYTFNVGQYAGSTVQFAFDAISSWGNQLAIDSFFVGPKTTAMNVALSGGTENGAVLSPDLVPCTDVNGWTYYTDSNSGRYLFGVQWDPANSGANAGARGQATAKITADRKWYSAENAALKMATYTMQRYWDVNLNGAVITGPVNVRFFYAQSEFDSIMVAKANFIAANPGATDEGFWWFKTVSGEFIPSPASVTYDSVLNSLKLQNVNFSNASINGVLYAQFNGITSFSGGTAASGVGPVIVVPVGLLSFNAQRNAKANRLTWTTTQEINTDKFIVEHSTDGIHYTAIGEVAAAGNSANNIDYSYIDYIPAMGINFYRLRVAERTGTTKFSAVRSVRNEGTADIAVYPNPVKDRMLINITSDKIDKAVISISDMNGRILQAKSNAITEGINYININTASMDAGTYIIKIQLNDDMVVKKVNKL